MQKSADHTRLHVAELPLWWAACLTLFLVLCGCGAAETDLRKEIESLEQQAFEGDSLVPDVASMLMVRYAELARRHPEDPFVAEALFRRADLLMAAGKHDDAILQLQDLHDGFPAFDKRARCAFLVAFIYETSLKDFELAERSYARVISLHPGTFEAKISSESLRALERQRAQSRGVLN